MTTDPLTLSIARVAHEVNRSYCAAIGDYSQLPWDQAPEWQQQSSVMGTELHLNDPNAGPEASHKSWMTQKIADGWVYGQVKDPVRKTHPCIMAFASLPREQQIKDHLFCAIVRAIAEEQLR